MIVLLYVLETVRFVAVVIKSFNNNNNNSGCHKKGFETMRKLTTKFSLYWVLPIGCHSILPMKIVSLLSVRVSFMVRVRIMVKVGLGLRLGSK
jgi:hypothetical protein